MNSPIKLIKDTDSFQATFCLNFVLFFPIAFLLGSAAKKGVFGSSFWGFGKLVPF